MSLFAGTELYRPPKCERCEQLIEDCQCPPPEPERTPPEKLTARLSVEKRKKGKLVTVVRGLGEGMAAPFFSELLSQLKQHCGAGGTIQNDVIEIQGDHLQRIHQWLIVQGYRVG